MKDKERIEFLIRRVEELEQINKTLSNVALNLSAERKYILNLDTHKTQ